MSVFNNFSEFCQHYLGLWSVSSFLLLLTSALYVLVFPCSHSQPCFRCHQLSLLLSHPDSSQFSSFSCLTLKLLATLYVQAAGGRSCSRPPPVCCMFYFPSSSVNQCLAFCFRLSQRVQCRTDLICFGFTPIHCCSVLSQWERTRLCWLQLGKNPEQRGVSAHIVGKMTLHLCIYLNTVKWLSIFLPALVKWIFKPCITGWPVCKEWALHSLALLSQVSFTRISLPFASCKM